MLALTAVSSEPVFPAFDRRIPLGLSTRPTVGTQQSLVLVSVTALIGARVVLTIISHDGKCWIFRVGTYVLDFMITLTELGVNK